MELLMQVIIQDVNAHAQEPVAQVEWLTVDQIAVVNKVLYAQMEQLFQVIIQDVNVQILHALIAHVLSELPLEEQIAVVKLDHYVQMELLIQVIIQDVNVLILNVQLLHVLMV